CSYPSLCFRDSVSLLNHPPSPTRRSSDLHRNKIIAISAMVTVVAGTVGFSLAKDSGQEDNINDGITDIIDDGTNRIDAMNASTDGEAALIYAQEELANNHF